MITLLRDALAAVWHAAAVAVNLLTRDKGYAVAATSGAEHELDYYTAGPYTYWTQDLADTFYRVYVFSNLPEEP